MHTPDRAPSGAALVLRVYCCLPLQGQDRGKKATETHREEERRSKMPLSYEQETLQQAQGARLRS